MKRRAIRFDPKDRGHTLPFSTFIDAMKAMQDGLESARRVTIKQLAAKVGRKLDVETLLRFEVGEPERGSYAVPLRLSQPPGLDLDNDCSKLFWPTFDGVINDAAEGRESTLPASAALDFAKAARVAGAQGATVEIAERRFFRPRNGDGYGGGSAYVSEDREDSWASVVAISAHEEKFRRYAERLSVEYETTRTIIGKLSEIRFDEPGITINTGAKSVRVRIHVEHKTLARELGEQVVIAEIKGRATRHGAVIAPVLVRMQAATVVSDVRAHFASTKGPADPHWNSAEAAEYFSNLRKSEPD